MKWTAKVAEAPCHLMVFNTEAHGDSANTEDLNHLKLLKEARMCFLLRRPPKSTHAIINMHASARGHCNDAYLDNFCSTLMQMRTVNSPQLILVTFLVTRKTIERKNISFPQRISTDGAGGFAA